MAQRSITITIRLKPEEVEFLKTMNLSPSEVLHNAISVLRVQYESQVEMQNLYATLRKICEDLDLVNKKLSEMMVSRR